MHRAFSTWPPSSRSGGRPADDDAETHLYEDLLVFSVKGMNCSQCGSEFPPGGAYCPVCGARRSELDRFVTEARDAAKKAISASVTALDRAADEIQPMVERVLTALQPAVDGIGKAVEPLAEATARATREVANAFRPAADETIKVARNVADRTVAAVRPAYEKVVETTQAAARRIRDVSRRRE